jgi:hypothetical protein
VSAALLAVNSNDAYSDQVKEAGAGLALLAAVCALEHMDEVSDVVKNLNQASANVRVLNDVIAQSASAIKQQAMIGETRQRLDTVARQIQQLRTEVGCVQPKLTQQFVPVIASS